MAPIDGVDERYFYNKVPGRTYYSKTFRTEKPMRFHDRVFENGPAASFYLIDKELVIRETHSGRVQIKAVVVDDDRSIKTLIVQKYGEAAGPSGHARFTFKGGEIDALLDFISSIPTVPLEGETKLRLTDEDMRRIKLTHGQASSFIRDNLELILQFAQSEHLTRDLVAVGYRRKQLDRFRAMMADPTTDEPTWQAFFEENTWIFGYGLSYQFLSSLDGKKLEQTVRGADIDGPGKRVDALMKTRGRINSLCFVEIKKHSTPLVSREYRSGVWAPHYELAGGVAQVQNTVHTALENLARALRPRHEDGGRTGEVLYNIQPRSCLVIGNLADLYGEHGLDEDQYRSFELYRRNITSPEILTFDELLERAQFIVEHAHQASEEDDDDIPF
jgi:hypothetical protein